MLEDEEVANRFSHFEENKDFFGGLSQKDVALAFMQFVELMKNQGVEFDSSEQEKINAIEKTLPMYQRGRYVIIRNYDGVNSEELYNAAMGILCSRQKLENFLECQEKGKPYNNISSTIMTDYILDGLRRCLERISISEEVYKASDFLFMKRNWLSISSYKVDSTKRLNPEFEKGIFNSIDDSCEPAKLALDINNALNRSVEYNNNIGALNQDVSLKEILDMYSTEFDKTSKDNNLVTCKQLAELYAYLLDKEGFDAYVCGYSYHKSVVAAKGTTIIKVDSSSTIPSQYDTSFMKDVTRSKLGVRLAGFQAYTVDGYSDVIMSIDAMKLNYNEDDTHISTESEVKELVSQIEENDNRNLSAEIMKLEGFPNKMGSSVKKILFINQMLRKSSLVNSDEVAYLYTLWNSILTEEERESVCFTNVFYQGVNTNQCRQIPIVSMKIDRSVIGSINEEYLYFILDSQAHSLRAISQDELKKRVASGEYIRGITGKVKVVPGLPEITDSDWIKEQGGVIIEELVTPIDSSGNNVERL
jgi:hypothetical protein